MTVLHLVSATAHMKYPGGKGKCYQRLINLMPPHHTYVESHLGADAVMRNKKPAVRNIGIDLDPAVHGAWSNQVHDRLELVQGDATSFLSSFPYQGNELIYADPTVPVPNPPSSKNLQIRV
jgi:DNA adenine methylase